MRCGLTLGMTEAEVEALPNGTELLGLWADNDIETFRDMISWLAQTLASIVLVNRSGGIYLKTYGMTVVDEVTEENRFLDATFSDFESRYSGVSVVDIKAKQTRYYGAEEDIYLTYNLGSNPFMQYGTNSTKERMARAILNSLAATAYVPFSVTMLGDPAYDLGDVITLSGGMGDGSKRFVIQRYSYNVHNNYSCEGVGKNPDVANARSKTDKNLTGLMSQINGKEFQYYIYRNLEAINIGNTQEREIVDIRFTSLVATVVIFEAEILLDVETLESGITYNDAVGTIKYYIDYAEITEYHPVETWVDGNHILHLLYHLNIADSTMTRFVATLTMNGGSAYIPVQGVQASIHGQGLVATEEWDGYLDFKETIGEITLGGIEVEDNILDTATTWLDTPYNPTGEDTLGEIDLGGFEVEDNMSDMLLIDKDMMSVYTHQELTEYTHAQLNNLMIYG